MPLNYKSDLNDKEIMKASNAIDKALDSINNENRGEVAVRILSVVRNLNDHIAYKIWHEEKPNQPMDLQKVASKYSQIGKYKFIARFDSFLRVSVSHFTPTEDGAERLILKYFNYLLKLKKVMRERYNVNILHNISNFIENLDTQTKDYYEKVSLQVEYFWRLENAKTFDNFYIIKNKPFFVNEEIYYEVTLEPASERTDKFNRITAFTKHELNPNYCVAVSFIESKIDVFGVSFPIRIITDWKVSIRPCEINNFADLLGININIQRSHGEYKELMDYLTQELSTLVDIIDLPDSDYTHLKTRLSNAAKSSYSKIFSMLDKSRYYSINGIQGKNIIRFLLNNMNNRMIKDQRPYDPDKVFYGLRITTKCKPFEDHPYAFNPSKHYSNLYDLLECIDPTNRKAELLYRQIEKSTSQNNTLYSSIDDLSSFGNETEIETLIYQFNNSLFSGFRPQSELAKFNNYVFIKGNEDKTIEVLQNILNLSSEISSCSMYYDENDVDELENLNEGERLDDPVKKEILLSMLLSSKVHFVFGAAGTGKTTLLNHISHLMLSGQRAFLAKTNPAVQNLRRKIASKKNTDCFVTIDKFNNNYMYRQIHFDLIVVDECSTVKNEELLKIISDNDISTIVLVGDIYQIEAIGFGNWFNISKKLIGNGVSHELTNTFRSDDEQLKNLWNLVRTMNDDNTVLEQVVRNDYSHIIDNDIFIKKSEDEIILCLNYNGLYGLNNINRLLQLNNPHPVIKLGVWEFKIDDPILFNDSERFKCLYNNLKGRIVNITDFEHRVEFSIRVDIVISQDEADADGLEILEVGDDYTIISFGVDRRAPYSSDEEDQGTNHILPFQIAYAVSIHKSQGLEYDSVKIVIADESEDRINHSIFYTAITRARKELTIYWSPEICNKVLNRIRPNESNKDYNVLLARNPDLKK